MKSIKFLLIIFSLSVFVMCNNNKAKQPVKHANVPKEAVWYGGKDGGSWITVDSGRSKNSFYISVFNDFTGEKQIDTLFVLSKPCCDIGLNVDSIYKYIEAYDGSRVILSIIKDGKYCYLTPEDEI